MNHKGVSLPSREAPNHCWMAVVSSEKRASMRSGDCLREKPSMEEGGEGWIWERKVVIGRKGKATEELLRSLRPQTNRGYIRKPSMTSVTHSSVSRFLHNVIRPTMTQPDPPLLLCNPPPQPTLTTSIYW